MTAPQIGIPSHNRPVALRDKTLRLLRDRHYPMDRVTVFVHNPTEQEQYKRANPDIRILIGEDAWPGNRNASIRHYQPGTDVVFMDDDVTDIRGLTTGAGTQPIHQLVPLFAAAFDCAHREGLSLWGVTPVDNAYFMRNTVSTTLKFIVGPLFGMVITHAPHAFMDLTEKGDYQRTLRFYQAEGGVIRLNYVSVVTDYYRNTGGIDHSVADQEAAVQQLEAEFPGLVRRNPRRKSGYPEILLRRPKRIRA